MTISSPRPAETQWPGLRGELGLISALCAGLDDRGIRYCHWKSTASLDRAALGQTDLDLLVAHPDLQAFDELARELGFKRGSDLRSLDPTGIWHVYGLDASSGVLVDVHVHSRLRLGDDATKSYRLPLEDAYLGSTVRLGPFRVPPPALEMVVLVVRLMIKHASPEAIATGRSRLSVTERDELAYLRRLVRPDDIVRVLLNDASFLSPDGFDRCLRALSAENQKQELLAAWRMLEPSIRRFAARDRPSDIWLQIWRRTRRRVSRLALGRSGTRRLAGGGKVIAVVGADGSGKSTVVGELTVWLSQVSTVASVHLGKPPRSIWRLSLQTVMRIRRVVLGSRPRDPWAIMRVQTARDRWRAAQHARGRSDRGWIVICDRYPLPGLLFTDGPALRGTRSPTGPVGRYLAGKEEEYYRRIPPPDVVVVLTVPPEIAVARRKEADPATVRARAQEVSDAGWRAGEIVVDAARPAKEVLLEVKARLWPLLR